MANNFTRYFSKNVGTSAVSVLTGPAGTQTTVIGLTIANTSVSPIMIDVYITSGGTDYYMVKGADVPVGGTLVAVGGDQKLVITTGDVLNVKSSAATSADVILSVLNIT